MLLLFLLAAIGGSTYTMGKAALALSQPTFLIAVRLLLAGSLFLGYGLLSKFQMPKIKTRDYFLFAQIAFFGFYFSYVMHYWALQQMTSSKSAFLYSLTPIVAAILSYFSFKEKITVKKILGLGIGLLGFIPELLASTSTKSGQSFSVWPELILLSAILSFTYGWIVIRKAIKYYGYPIIFINGIGMLLGGAAALITAYIFEIPKIADTSNWIMPWVPITNLYSFTLLTLGLVLLGNILYYTIYGILLKKYTVTTITFGELLTPFFTLLYSWAFLSEAIQWQFFASMGTILVGLYIFYSEELKLGYIK